MEISELRARVRNQSGKGSSRRLRMKDSIPAVFYGPKSESIQLAVNTPELMKLMKNKEENVFIKLLIGDENHVEKLSMIKEMQTDPLTKRLLHIDFYEIRMDQKITVDIPIHITGQPIGVEHGGEFHHLKRDVKVSCLPGKLPDYIEVDVKNLDIGNTITIREIKMDDAITILDSEDTAIAVVSAPKIVKEEVEPSEETASEAAEGEKGETKEE